MIYVLKTQFQGGGGREGTYVYLWFTLLYSRNQHNIEKQFILQLTKMLRAIVMFMGWMIFMKQKQLWGNHTPKNIILGIPRPSPSPHIQRSTALYFLFSGIDNKWECVVYLWKALFTSTEIKKRWGWAASGLPAVPFAHVPVLHVWFFMVIKYHCVPILITQEVDSCYPILETKTLF